MDELEHNLTFDSEQGIYEVWCPAKKYLLPLAKEPNFCPMCGDKIKISTEREDDKGPYLWPDGKEFDYTP